MLEDINKSLDSIVNFIKGVDNAFNNPGGELVKFLGNFFKECFETFAIASFDILVIVGFFALLLYVFGWKKGKDISLMCPCIYIIVKILAKCLI